ncbi:MAG: signal peptidase I, partial [Bryobacteraceae bacterium]
MSEPAPEAIPQAPQCASATAHPSHSALIAAAVWIRDLMLAVLIAVLAILFLYRPVRVEGTSMMPSLYNQERLFINQFSYRFGLDDIKRGDTVVFWYPEDTTKSYIKRVIGLPGDRVQIIDGYVYINGKKLIDKYVPQRYRDDRDWG